MPHDVSLDTRLEGLAFDYGRELFARLGRSDSLPLSPRWWDDRLMNWTMSAEAVKVQLFRFIDVLPLLHSPREVNRHLREYFTEASPH
jgi:RHH-type proline utilization regulon transcriptional repressor/proline dehydrogenase/delta 1-pyrroline-5-carboxylate dehydrogenase